MCKGVGDNCCKFCMNVIHTSILQSDRSAVEPDPSRTGWLANSMYSTWYPNYRNRCTGKRHVGFSCMNIAGCWKNDTCIIFGLYRPSSVIKCCSCTVKRGRHASSWRGRVSEFRYCSILSGTGSKACWVTWCNYSPPPQEPAVLYWTSLAIWSVPPIPDCT